MAAEPSGDLQGAALARALQARLGEVDLVGVGCREMQAAGVKLLADASTWGTIGPSSAFAKLLTIYLAYRKMRHVLRTEPAEVTVVIDSPAIYMRLTGYLKRYNLKTIYYFPPSAWSTNPERFKEIHRRVTGVITTFDFNYENYRKLELPVAHYGHPMVDLFEPLEAGEAKRRLGVDLQQDYAALLPGSRTQEISLLTPLLLRSAELMRRQHPELRFLLPTASVRVEKQLHRMLKPAPDWLTLVSGQSREVMAASRVALMCSGSATLEGAMLNTPMVIFYKFGRLDWALGRLLRKLGLLRVDRFALPNLVLDEDALPEFLQEQATPETLAAEALKLLVEGDRRDRHLEVLGRVRESLGRGPVVARVAAFVDYIARGRSPVEALEAVENESWTSS